jgi:hypothetical protein
MADKVLAMAGERNAMAGERKAMAWSGGWSRGCGACDKPSQGCCGWALLAGVSA